ncbi:hypothetical protein ACXWR7_13850, partial [Streptococcus pyogenes]
TEEMRHHPFAPPSPPFPSSPPPPPSSPPSPFLPPSSPLFFLLLSSSLPFSLFPLLFPSFFLPPFSFFPPFLPPPSP